MVLEKTLENLLDSKEIKQCQHPVGSDSYRESLQGFQHPGSSTRAVSFSESRPGVGLNGITETSF